VPGKQPVDSPLKLCDADRQARQECRASPRFTIDGFTAGQPLNMTFGQVSRLTNRRVSHAYIIRSFQEL